jgi:AcrR family transcriptional regulator
MATPRKSGDERREEIAWAALRILATQGVHRLTAARIGEEVGLRDGSLFRHFDSMDAMVSAGIEQLIALLEPSFARPEPTPLERLRGFVVSRIDAVRRHPEILRLAFNDRLEEAAGVDGAGRFRSVVERSRAFVRTCLTEGQADGTIRGDVPTFVLEWAVLGVIRGVATTASPDAPDVQSTWGAVAALLRPPITAPLA